jgi:uncharacterized protein YkwD
VGKSAKIRQVIAACLPICLAPVASAVNLSVTPSKPVERAIPMSLASAFCERPIQTADLVSHGLYDAQVDVIMLRPKDAQSKIQGSLVKQRAIELATAAQQLGYGYGVCDNGQGWVLTFPAPEPVTLNSRTLTVSKKAAQNCLPKSLKVLFASEQKGRSFLVPLNQDLAAQLPDSKGYASVVCSPAQFAASGPREWALISLGGARVNAAELLPPQGLANQEALIQWINQKRLTANLPSLAVDRELSAVSTGLAARKLIHHDLNALVKIRSALEKKGLEVFGENRVQGKSLAEIAGLLWMSPSHRDLLLHPNAESMGFVVKETDAGLFAVMVVGRKTAGPVAKNGL